jgi:methylmalonyl-CoA mutase, N-terminal domain
MQPRPEIADATSSGLPIGTVYSSDDLTSSGFDPEIHLGRPGSAPYTRGVRTGMYRDEPWVMGMYSGAASARDTNTRIRSLLAQGQRGFSIALDLPTQLGLDSSDPRGAGEVGTVGVPLDTVEDMKTVLDGIVLSDVRQIRTTANAIGPIVAAMFIVAAEEGGYSPTQFRVMFQNDVLKEYVARGTFIFPPRAGLKFSVDLVEYCARHLPNWEPIEFCGYHYRDSGSTAVQEVAFPLANALEYLGEARARGLTIDQLGHSFFMFLSGGLSIFEEASKFRAARRIWSTLIEERFAPQTEHPRRLNIFCYTLGGAQTAREPLNNIVRIAYQSLSAVLGGAQVLATTAYDEAFQLPSDEAVRIALRTQQILAFETDAARTADPLGGSYFVETLTLEIEREIRDYLAQIEELGGALAALESGWVAAQLEDAAYAQQLRIEQRDQVVVGVNAFVDQGIEASPLRHRYVVDPAALDDQVRRLEAVKAARDARVVESAVMAVRVAAEAGDNLVEPIVAAVRVRASIGEIVDSLRAVWGAGTSR